MELTETLLADIHAYLSNGMTPQQQLAFEAQMQANPALAQEVRTQQRIKQGLRILQRKNELKALHQTLLAEGALPEMQASEPVPPKRIMLWQPLAAAACVGLLITGVWLYQTQTPDASTGTSLQTNGYTPPARPIDYAEQAAMRRLDNAFAQQYAPDSIRAFINNPYPLVAQRAEWYLALSYQRVGEQAKAQELWQEIAQNAKHSYYKQAVEALRKIEK